MAYKCATQRKPNSSAKAGLTKIFLLLTSYFGLLVHPHIPFQLATSPAQGFGYGAVFVHRQLAGAPCLIRVDIAGEFKNEGDALTDGGFFTGIPLSL